MISQGLRIFIQVVDCGSFSKAAQRLFVTPASIMKQMNALESRLGLVLLKRSNQGIELTAAGRSVYEDGKRLLAEAGSALENARLAEQMEGTIIRVGSSFLNPSKILTDFWKPFRSKYPKFKFSIVPYDDDREQILSVVASLGKKIDLLVGAFNSRQMLERSNYLELGTFDLCIAVPQNHRLADHARLSIRDLYGEHLIMVKSGDTDMLTAFHDMLQMTHPQIVIESTHYYYDMETFNHCERTGSLLLTLSAWIDVHPSLITLPVDWNFQIPYGILYAKEPSDDVAEFIEVIRSSMLSSAAGCTICHAAP